MAEDAAEFRVLTRGIISSSPERIPHSWEASDCADKSCDKDLRFPKKDVESETEQTFQAGCINIKTQASQLTNAHIDSSCQQ